MFGSGPQAAAGIREGDILAGKYRVERVLGIGGMGLVVAAYHQQLGTKVAIKFLLPAILTNERAVHLFAEEARREAMIASEHVARVLDVGTLENGAPFKVMEFLEGENLADWIQKNGPMPIEQAIDFVLQTCVAVADAHALGIVHRDLKPANLFCIRRSDGQLIIKVLDFGISKLTDPSRASEPPGMSLTKTGTVVGSPLYMSPEQAQNSKDVDARTDVWALGVILYELLAGKVPFPGEEYGAVLGKILVQPPPSLRGYRPDVPPGLEATVLKCLEKDRNRRYGNVAELALALLLFAPKRAKPSVERIAAIIQGAKLAATSLAPPPSSVSSPPQPASTQLASGMLESVPPGWEPHAARGRRVVAGAAALVVLGLAAAGWVVASRKSAVSPENSGKGASNVEPSVDTTAAAVCLPGATKCIGTTLQSCSGGRWVSSAVTAGQCDAVCTPGTSAPKCKGNVPQTCASSGQWENGEACPRACSTGRCTGVCAPGTTRCSGITAVQTCGSDGQWANAQACARSSLCRDGVCTASTLPPGREPAAAPKVAPKGPALAAPARPDCDPPTYLDSHGDVRFKPECFGVPSSSSHAP